MSLPSSPQYVATPVTFTALYVTTPVTFYGIICYHPRQVRSLGSDRGYRSELRKLFKLKDAVGELSASDERKFRCVCVCVGESVCVCVCV